MKYSDEYMVVKPNKDSFNLLAVVGNRPFVYNLKLNELYLGSEYNDCESFSDIVEKCTHHIVSDSEYTFCVYGWVGKNKKEYKNGIIHFVVGEVFEKRNVDAFYEVLKVFRKLGFGAETVLRGYMEKECKMGYAEPELFA